MTRKQRKQSRKKKSENWLTPELNKLLKEAAQKMSARKFPVEDYDKKTYCPNCKQTYCLGHDGTDTTCKDCYWQPCCIKVLNPDRICQKCKGELK